MWKEGGRPGAPRGGLPAILGLLAVSLASACGGSSGEGAPRGPFAETARLAASDAAAGDRFGVSVAIGGGVVAVGADKRAVDDDILQGAVYVFTRPTGSSAATEVALLTASDRPADDGFGWAVGVSGDTIAVAAPFADSGAAGTEGAAYVFVRPRGGWTTMTETAKLTASDGETDDDLGSAIAISGDVVVVGAPVDDAGVGVPQQGSAYVFVRPLGGWSSVTETARLTASDGSAFDGFGTSVAIDRDSIVIGAPGHRVGSNEEQGAVYLFRRPPGGWATMTETAKLTASDGSASDRFGRSVGISGSTVAVGAYLDGLGEDEVASGSGYVFLVMDDGRPTSTEVAKLAASGEPEHASLGWSIAVGNETVVVGALLADVGDAVDQGAAFVFVRPRGGWVAMTETAKLTATEGGPDAQSGFSVGIDGAAIAVGVPGAIGPRGMQGAAYLFESGS
jgi:hypothetical protein